MNNDKDIILDLQIDENQYSFHSSIEAAMYKAEQELVILQETIDSVKILKPECDKIDYALAASIGALAGVFDVFLVGKPGKTAEKNNSLLTDTNDKWFENKVKLFAKMCGWKEDKSWGTDKSTSKAIEFLEKKFKIPYDQTGRGDAGRIIYDLSPNNHHFKSLAHNPSLIGLFFSIVDQFTNSSHFISGTAYGGLDLMALQEADGNFVLRGKTVLGKCIAAFVNWFGHLLSDMAGSSSSKGRGMGIPSPLWTWTNDILAVKRSMHIESSEFDESLNGLAMDIYLEGYDYRFQKLQAVPVMINELLVRIVYSIRRMISYYSNTEKSERSFKKMMAVCKPYGNPTVKRMLTVAHGTFCMIDITDALIRSGGNDPREFYMRLNLIGVGRFTISLYGETNRAIRYHKAKKESILAEREKSIIEDYMEGLRQLSVLYDDAELLAFVDDLKRSDMYVSAFNKTVALAELRKVPEDRILRTKEDIDSFFKRGKK